MRKEILKSLIDIHVVGLLSLLEIFEKDCEIDGEGIVIQCKEHKALISKLDSTFHIEIS